jgi:hypothetical protein
MQISAPRLADNALSWPDGVSAGDKGPVTRGGAFLGARRAPFVKYSGASRAPPRILSVRQKRLAVTPCRYEAVAARKEMDLYGCLTPGLQHSTYLLTKRKPARASAG